MKTVAWFNFSVAVFCALIALTCDSSIGEIVNALLCALNVFSGGVNISISNKPHETEAAPGRR